MNSATSLMQIGKILHISSRGHIQVQIPGRIVHAQIISGGGQRGDLVEGYMRPGLCTWMSSMRRRMIVDVESPVTLESVNQPG
jgi:hypothetical protein